jgi:uncharacterized protein (DUF488 family)
MAELTLATIGYEGSVIDDFVATLQLAQVEIVLDVRDVPISRKRGFSKSALEAALAAGGLGYVHLKGLGDPKPGRVAAREGRFSEFRKIFGDHLQSTAARTDLRYAIELTKTRAVCLVCFERDHKNCHRCMIAEEMSKQAGFRIRHLGVRSGSGSSIRGWPANAGSYAFVG